jgi:hypothetical protein
MTFWRYAEIWLNPDRLRTVQSRINFSVTLNWIHHIGTKKFRLAVAGAVTAMRKRLARGAVSHAKRASPPRGATLDAAATSH